MPTPNTQGLVHLLRSGGAPLMAIGLLGRLPTAMTPMLLLVAIPVGGGSLVQAGTAVGFSALGTATSAAAVGLLIDRFGARTIVTTIAIIQSTALLGLAAQFGRLDDSPWLLPLAFIVGLSNPAIGALARAAWVRRADDGELDHHATRSAMAWEASSSEAAFVIGPVAASLVLDVAEPRAVLIGLALVGFVIHVNFVRIVPLPAPVRARRRRRRSEQGFGPLFDASAGRHPGVLVVAALLVASAVGLVFGATQATLNALFDALGSPSMVGPVYGVLGLGSIVGGLAWAQTPDRFRGPWIIPAAGATLTMAGMVAVNAASLGVAAACLLCAMIGLWLSPVLAETHNQARMATSGRFKVTMMTVFASGTSVGVAIGAPLSSTISTMWESQAGFLALAVSGTVFLAAGGYIALRQR